MDLSQVSNATTQITGLSNLIVVSPQDLKQFGYQAQKSDGTKYDAFLFHYEAENSINLESDITDHFIEDNTAINDQIALRPEIVTVRGFIGELNDVVPAAVAPLKIVADKLVALSQFSPQLSESALRAYNQAFYLYNVAANAVDAAVTSYGTITDAIQGQQSSISVISSDGLSYKNTQTKQQEAFVTFYDHWKKRRLFTIQTPWAIFENMAIKSLRAVQDAESAVITDFEINFKMMRFAKSYTRNKTQGRLQNQSSTLVDKGTSTLSPSSDSFVDKLLGGL